MILYWHICFSIGFYLTFIFALCVGMDVKGKKRRKELLGTGNLSFYSSFSSLWKDMF